MGWGRVGVGSEAIKGLALLVLDGSNLLNHFFESCEPSIDRFHEAVHLVHKLL